LNVGWAQLTTIVTYRAPDTNAQKREATDFQDGEGREIAQFASARLACNEPAGNPFQDSNVRFNPLATLMRRLDGDLGHIRCV
jgi:hypothetical protein